MKKCGANGDALDNRRENLRLCTPSQNLANMKKSSKSTSGIKGVSWSKRHRKWEAWVSVNGRRIFLGSFNTPEASHAAYARAARQHYGEFARAE